MPNDFAHVARLFSPDPPDWIAEALAEYALHIGGPEVTRTRQDYLDDVALFIALDKVEAELGPYLEPEYLNLLDDNTRDAFENLDQGIGLVLAHIKETLGPLPIGRPRQLGRHLCAKLCSDIWTRCQGKAQPWSTKLHDACQAYWIACGGSADSISWRNILNGYD
jgi:hypothetical protein